MVRILSPASMAKGRGRDHQLCSQISGLPPPVKKGLLGNPPQPPTAEWLTDQQRLYLCKGDTFSTPPRCIAAGANQRGCQGTRVALLQVAHGATFPGGVLDFQPSAVVCEPLSDDIDLQQRRRPVRPRGSTKLSQKRLRFTMQLCPGPCRIVPSPG